MSSRNRDCWQGVHQGLRSRGPAFDRRGLWDIGDALDGNFGKPLEV